MKLSKAQKSALKILDGIPKAKTQYITVPYEIKTNTILALEKRNLIDVTRRFRYYETYNSGFMGARDNETIRNYYTVLFIKLKGVQQ